MPTLPARARDWPPARPVDTGRTRDGRRVLRLAVAGAGLYRGVGLTALFAGGGIGSTPMAVAGAAATAWSVVLIWDGWRRGAFRRELAGLDVGFAFAIGTLSLMWGPAGMELGHTVLQGTAIVAGCALSVRGLAVATSALVVSSLLAVLVPPAAGGVPVTEVGAYAATLAVLALATTVGYRLVRTAADAVDRRHADRAGLDKELVEQRRMLHDTALATLTAIANGLDVRSDQVRARCARDAAYLRLAMQGGPAGAGVADRGSEGRWSGGTRGGPRHRVRDGPGWAGQRDPRLDHGPDAGGRRRRGGGVHPGRGNLRGAEMAGLIRLAAVDDDDRRKQYATSCRLSIRLFAGYPARPGPR